MADIFSVSGIGAEYVTMKIKSGVSLVAGNAVILTANNEVGFPASGTGSLFGIVSVVDGTSGYATVQYKGFVEDVACNTTTNPALGDLVAVTTDGKLTAKSLTTTGEAVASLTTSLVGNKGICVSIDATNDVATILM